jgi:hypothetical protein
VQHDHSSGVPANISPHHNNVQAVRLIGGENPRNVHYGFHVGRQFLKNLKMVAFVDVLLQWNERTSRLLADESCTVIRALDVS